MEVPWEKVFGAAAMKDDNENVILSGCDVILKELGYHEYNKDAKQ